MSVLKSLWLDIRVWPASYLTCTFYAHFRHWCFGAEPTALTWGYLIRGRDSCTIGLRNKMVGVFYFLENFTYMITLSIKDLNA